MPRTPKKQTKEPATPRGLTEHVVAEVASKVRIGGSLRTALMAAGIAWERYQEWCEDALAGNAAPLVEKFLEAVLEAEAEVKLLREHQLSKHFDAHWQAAAWWLERRYPNEYGVVKDRTDSRGPDFDGVLDLRR